MYLNFKESSEEKGLITELDLNFPRSTRTREKKLGLIGKVTLSSMFLELLSRPLN